MLASNEWIQNQWPSRAFYDPRVHGRTIQVAQACLNFPDCSIPGRFPTASGTKGCYRFLSRTDLGHEKLQREHYDYVLKKASKTSSRVLFIQDGSELIYNTHSWTSGLGPTSDSSGQGLMFHSCLAVNIGEELPQVIGLACQKAWIRVEEKNEKLESGVWLEMLKRIGQPPERCMWTHVCDRGGDIFSLVEGTKALGWDCVIRSKHDRKIRVNGEEIKLKSHLRSLPTMGKFQHQIRARPGVPGREVTLRLSWVEAEMMPPAKEKEGEPIKGSYVRVWCEEDPTIEWILFTLSPIASKEQAIEVAKIYTLRWIIEEYHKCLKTGCKIEEAQLRTADRLLNLFGILGVVATQLLILRDQTRMNGSDPAEKHVDPLTVKLIEKKYKLQGPVTVKEFWRRVAMLGGFLGRKADGNPGWQTIWRGWSKLQDMCRGVELFLSEEGLRW